MQARWKKSIKTKLWQWLRPWAQAKEQTKRAELYKARLKEQGRQMLAMQQALRRKKAEIIRMGLAYAKALHELELMRCSKVKHVSKTAADKASARVFNQTSHVMESYECYVCPKNPDTGSKWWHIRHAVKSQRGKHGPVRKNREAS